MSKKEFLSPEFAEAQAAIDAELSAEDQEIMDAIAADANADSPPDNGEWAVGKEWDVVKQKWVPKGNKSPMWDKDGKWLGPEFNKPGVTGGYSTGAGWSGSSTGYQGKLKPVCNHKPQLVIQDKKTGLEISFGKKWDCEDRLEDFHVAVNLTGSSVARKHIIPIESLKKWMGAGSAKEIVLDWPDMGILKFPLEFWDDLTQAILDEGGKCVIFCQGGHGRTGTAMACLLISVLGFSAEEAKKWIWENYCDQAIETKSQEDYVADIWKQYRRKHKLPERDKKKNT